MNDFTSYIDRKRAQYGEKFDPSDLTQPLIRFWENGQRVKVSAYGEERTGTIGVTTGWKPCFLLMARRNCYGSSYPLNRDTRIVAVKRGKTYIPVA